MRETRVVRELRLCYAGPGDSYSDGGREEVRRFVAPGLLWREVCALVVPWALSHGCEVERYDAADTGARVLNVFAPFAEPGGLWALQWTEAQEACPECGAVGRLVERASGHREVDCLECAPARREVRS